MIDSNGIFNKHLFKTPDESKNEQEEKKEKKFFFNLDIQSSYYGKIQD